MLTDKNKADINELVRQYLNDNNNLKININSDYDKIVILNSKDVGIIYSLLKDLRDSTGLDSFSIEQHYSTATDETFYIININEGE